MSNYTVSKNYSNAVGHNESSLNVYKTAAEQHASNSNVTTSRLTEKQLCNASQFQNDDCDAMLRSNGRCPFPSAVATVVATVVATWFIPAATERPSANGIECPPCSDRRCLDEPARRWLMRLATWAMILQLARWIVTESSMCECASSSEHCARYDMLWNCFYRKVAFMSINIFSPTELYCSRSFNSNAQLTDSSSIRSFKRLLNIVVTCIVSFLSYN